MDTFVLKPNHLCLRQALDRGWTFPVLVQETPVSVAGSGPRTVSSLRQGVQRQLQAKAAPGLVPLHKGHWKAFLVSPILTAHALLPGLAPTPGKATQKQTGAGQKRRGCGLFAHHVHGPRRLLLQAIARDNPALEALSRAAAAVILLLPLSQLHLLPVEVQHPDARTIRSHPREGGRVEWRKERPHLKAPAPPPPPERLRVPGALTPDGSSPHRRVPSAPRPWRPSALTALSWGRSAGPGA